MKKILKKICFSVLLTTALTVTSLLPYAANVTATDTKVSKTVMVKPESSLNVQVKDNKGNFVNDIDASLIDDNGKVVATWKTGTNTVNDTNNLGIMGGKSFTLPWSRFQELVEPGRLEIIRVPDSYHGYFNSRIPIYANQTNMYELEWIMPYSETDLQLPGNTVATVIDSEWSNKNFSHYIEYTDDEDNIYEFDFSDNNVGKKVEYSIPAGSYTGMSYIDFHGNGGSSFTNNNYKMVVKSNPTEYAKVKIKLSEKCAEKFNDDGTVKGGSRFQSQGIHNYSVGSYINDDGIEIVTALYIVSGSVINAPIPDEQGYVEAYIEKSSQNFKIVLDSKFYTRNSQGYDVSGSDRLRYPIYAQRYTELYTFTPDLPDVGTNINNIPAGNYTLELANVPKQYKLPSKKSITVTESYEVQMLDVILEEIPAHIHTADESKWLSNAENHWHKCSTCDEDVQLDIAAHIPGPEATETSPQTCTVCGYEIAPKLEHVHNYEDTYKTDETNHWKECRCGNITDKSAHNFTWVTDEEATEVKAGSKHEECTVCGYKKEAVEIPALKPTEPDTEEPTPEQPTEKPEPDTEKPTTKQETVTQKQEQPSQKPTSQTTPVTGDNVSSVLLVLIITSVALFGGVVIIGNKKKSSEN